METAKAEWSKMCGCWKWWVWYLLLGLLGILEWSIVKTTWPNRHVVTEEQEKVHN